MRFCKVKLNASAYAAFAAVTLAAAVAATMPLAIPAHCEERDASKDAVANLTAYAAYKAGNYDEAKLIWEELAARGNTTAMINLANLFQQGQGVTEDQRQAMDYVRRAAELGDARAQHELGLAYEKGAIVGRDIEKAAMWLKKSAEQDYADGQFAYGVMLATARGKGLDKASEAERSEALEWLRKAKARGNVEADAYIAVLSKASS